MKILKSLYNNIITKRKSLFTGIASIGLCSLLISTIVRNNFIDHKTILPREIITATPLIIIKPIITKTITPYLPISGTQNGTYTGTAPTPWGDLTIEVNLENNTITEIESLAVPNSILSHYAVPILLTNQKKANTITIDSITGATYTSSAFNEAMRSLLKEAIL